MKKSIIYLASLFVLASCSVSGNGSGPGGKKNTDFYLDYSEKVTNIYDAKISEAKASSYGSSNHSFSASGSGYSNCFAPSPQYHCLESQSADYR